MKQKLISLVLAMAMVMSVCCYPIFAIAETGTEVELSLTADKTGDLGVGDEITVNVNVLKNPGINYVAAIVLFDTERFEFVAFDKNKEYKGDDEPGETFTLNTEQVENGKITFLSSSAYEFDDTGVYYVFKLKVKDTAKAGVANIGFKFGVDENDAVQYVKNQTIYYLTADNAKGMSLNVSIPTTAITISGANSIEGIGNTTQLTVAAQPANAAQPKADMSDVTWTSDKESVATVSNGLVTAVGEGTANIKAEFGGFTKTHAITVTKEKITGSVSYTSDGGMVYGAKLSASYSGSIENVVFTWYRRVDGEDIKIATGKEYTIAAEDIGYTIAVKATAENYSGELTYAEGTVDKAANTSTPAKPELYRDGNTVKVRNYDENAEYLFIDNGTDGEWQSAGSINAAVGHTYQVKVRYGATATVKASAEVSSGTLYIPYTPKLTVNVGGVGTVEGVPSSVTEGDKVTLTVKPDNDYTFVEWQGANGLNVDTKSATITFTVGQDDINLVAKMNHKANVSVTITNTSLTYNGSAQAPAFTPDAVEGMDVTVKYYYRNGNVAIDKPTDAGEYEIEITYTSSATSAYASTTARGQFEIAKASQVAPTAATVSNIKSSSFTVTYVDGQQYALSTSSNTPDEEDWVDTLVTTGLKPNTKYYVFNRVAADKNHTASACSVTEVTTNHSYSYEIVGGSTKEYTVRVGGQVPDTITFGIKNTGSGNLTVNDLKRFSGSNYFEFTNENWKNKVIAPGETYELVYKTTDAISNSTSGEYSSNVTFTLKFDGQNDNGITSTSGTLNMKISVKEKDDATIEGLTDVEYVFNGKDQTLDLSNVTVKGGDTELDASKLSVKYYYGTVEQTSTRNVLNYTAVVTYEDDNYVGSKTVNMTIKAKELTVSGFKAENKVYDGKYTATVDCSNVKLEGTIDGTDIALDANSLNANWEFVDDSVETNKAIYNKNTIILDSSCADVSNYYLNAGPGAIVLYADITPKEITVTATVADKTYNGLTADADVTLTMDGVCVGDDIALTNVNGTYASANAGDAVAVSVTYTVDGLDKDNYSLVAPKNVTGKVGRAELSVTLTAPEGEIKYDGKARTVTVSESGRVAADNGKTLYTITYNDGAAEPVNAGTYTAKAKLTDEAAVNYTLNSKEVSYEIKPMELSIADANLTYSVSYAYAGEHKYDISALSTVPAGISGKWSVDGTKDDNGILTGVASVADKKLVFSVKSGLVAANIGNSADVTLVFTPDSANYTTAKCTVKIVLAEDTYTTTITPALPSKIKLGEELDISKSYLVTEFGSGAPKQELNLADGKRVETDCQYDPAATGEAALGTKYIIVKDRYNSNITYTHTFTVVDVLSGTKLEADGTITLALGAKELPFENIKAVYKSGAKKALGKSDMTIAYADGMSEQRVLNTIGSHKVTVTYTETYFDDTSATQSCELTVIVSAETASIGGTSGNGFAVTPVPEGDKDISYTNPDGSVDADDVSAKLDGLEDGASKDAIKAEENKNNAFDAVGDNKVYEKIDFTDKDGNDVSFEGGSMQITVPYPSDSDKSDDFVIIIRDKDGNIETIVPIKGENGLQFTVKGDVEFVIGWYTPVKDEDESSKIDPEDSFWNEVYWTIIRSDKGSVITANAGYYDKVPQGVLRAVNLSGNTLIINSAYGIQLVITPNSLANIDGYRMYYPISYLNEVLKGATIGGNAIGGSTGVTVGVLMPTTGDDTVVTHPYTMTPATEGFFAADAAVKNSVIADAADADGISVLDDIQHNDGEIIGGAMLIGLGLLSLLGAAYVTLKKRENR